MMPNIRLPRFVHLNLGCDTLLDPVGTSRCVGVDSRDQELAFREQNHVAHIIPVALVPVIKGAI